jgi:hypothetical protein
MSKFYEEKLEYFGAGGGEVGYWDYSFIDVNPCHAFNLCYSEADDEWYGDKMYCATPEADWDNDRELDVTELQECIELIPIVELPSCVLVATIEKHEEYVIELKDTITELRANQAN